MFGHKYFGEGFFGPRYFGPSDFVLPPYFESFEPGGEIYTLSSGATSGIYGETTNTPTIIYGETSDG